MGSTTTPAPMFVVFVVELGHQLPEIITVKNRACEHNANACSEAQNWLKNRHYVPIRITILKWYITHFFSA